MMQRPKLVRSQPESTYILSLIGGERDRGYGRCVLRVASYSFSFGSADPLSVCGILHEPDVACMMLEVKREDSSLAFVPRLSS